jgi:hypothetical protein
MNPNITGAVSDAQPINNVRLLARFRAKGVAGVPSLHTPEVQTQFEIKAQIGGWPCAMRQTMPLRVEA